MTVEDTSSDSPPAKRGWRTALRFIGPLLFIWVLWTVDLGNVFGSVRHVPLRYLVAAVLICVVLVVVKGLRWHVLLHGLGCTEPVSTSLAVYGDAVFWGTLTPGRLGEFRKVLFLHRRHGLSWFRGTWYSLLDRVFDVFAILILFGMASLFLPVDLRSFFRPGFAMVFLIAAILVLALRRQWSLVLGRWAASGAGRLHRLVEAAARDAGVLSHRRLIVLILLSSLSLFLYASMVRALSWALPFELTFAQVVLCVVTSLLAGIVPISYFNLGSRELVLIGLFKVFGLSRENAISLSLMFLVCYLVLMFVGLFFWQAARQGRYYEDVRVTGVREAEVRGEEAPADGAASNAPQ
ncbi:MAG: flippase-like domain-containing protein [Phycisphaerales bacterium]|nr:flippase-like domain-containing protein [Phycisphaerales bacterium]